MEEEKFMEDEAKKEKKNRDKEVGDKNFGPHTETQPKANLTQSN